MTRQARLFEPPRGRVVVRWRCGWLTMRWYAPDRPRATCSVLTQTWAVIVRLLADVPPATRVQIRA